MKIADYLKPGINNKVSTAELMRLTGLDKRKLHEIIHKERKEGALILSTKKDGGGYFLPETLEELEECYESKRKEAISIFDSMKAIRIEKERRKALLQNQSHEEN